MSCAVKSCSNVKRMKPENVSFHSFPRGKSLTKWLSALSINPETWTWTKNKFVCSSHFEPDTFEIKSNRRFLKRGAIPCISSKVDCAPPSTTNEIIEMVCDDIEVIEEEIKIDQPDEITDIPEVMLKDPLMNDVSAIEEIQIDKTLENIVTEEKSEEIKDEILTLKCFNKICRVCLKEVDYFIKYSLCYFNEKSLGYYLKKYTGVSVDLMDCNGIRLPENICKDCMTTVLKLAEFAQKCQTSDEKLKEITNQFLDNDHDYISTRMSSINEDLPPFECNAENNIATNVKSPNETHVYLRDQKEWTCQICGRDGIRSLKSLRLHNIRKHKVTPIIEAPDRIKDRKCNICSKIYKTMRSMRQHMSIHTNEKPFQCEICGVKFKKKRNFETHRLRHDKNKNSKCDLCGQTCLNSIALLLHHRRVHKFQEKICEICGKLFKNQATYRHHMNRHNDIKILCPICGKYINKMSYTQHQKTHSGFKCRICYCGFATYHGLKVHTKIHRGINPYKCGYCKKTFDDPLVKAEHMKLDCRKNKQIYVCEVCNKAFAVELNLRCHMRIHTGDLPYECHVCNEKFNFIKGMKAHYAKFHKDVCIENKVFVKIKTDK